MPRYEKSQIAQEISFLLENPMSYEELAAKHGRLLKWIMHYLKKDEKLQQQVREIKRHALILSIKKLRERNEPINPDYVRQKYSYLERTARQIYPKASRKYSRSAWTTTAEEAGFEYPQQINWNLKKILSILSSLGNSPQDFAAEKTYKKNCPLVNAVKRYFPRCFGKGVILLGVDFLEKKDIKVPREAYRFRETELAKILHDESLNYQEKISCIFNALTFQYYNWQHISDRVWRACNSKEKAKFRTCQETSHFQGTLELLLQQNETNLILFKVLMKLGTPCEREQQTAFYFEGNNAGKESSKFYCSLDSLLTKIQGKRLTLSC